MRIDDCLGGDAIIDADHLEDFGASGIVGTPSLEDVYIESEISNIRLRRRVAYTMIFLFVVLNAAVIGMIFFTLLADLEMVTQDVDRVITENVFMALIAGTVAEVAVVLLGITSYLFPKPNGRSDLPATSSAGQTESRHQS